MTRKLLALVVALVLVTVVLTALPAIAAEAPPAMGYSPTSGAPGTVVEFTNVPACATTGDPADLHYGIGLSRAADDTAAATEKYGGPNVEFTIPKVADGDSYVVIFCSTLVQSYPFHVGVVARPRRRSSRRSLAELDLVIGDEWGVLPMTRRRGRTLSATPSLCAQRVLQEPALLMLLPSVLAVLLIWPPRKLTAAITARAMRATRRMYSTMLAPRSVTVDLARSHVRMTNRFMVLPLLSLARPKNCVGGTARGANP